MTGGENSRRSTHSPAGRATLTPKLTGEYCSHDHQKKTVASAWVRGSHERLPWPLGLPLEKPRGRDRRPCPSRLAGPSQRGDPGAGDRAKAAPSESKRGPSSRLNSGGLAGHDLHERFRFTPVATPSSLANGRKQNPPVSHASFWIWPQNGNIMRPLKTARRTICASLLAILTATGATADYRDQLSGRTLNVMVGFSNNGGGARFWSLFSTYMRRRLPETIIRAEFNDGPKAVEGIGKLYETEPGSLAIGLIRPPEFAFVQIDNPEDIAVDLLDAHWLLSVENLSYIMAARAKLPTSLDKLRMPADAYILPVNDPLSTASRISVLLSAVTGIPTRNVVGFGRSARKKALLAGDVDLLTIGIDSALKSVVESGDFVPLYKIVGDDFSALDASTPDLSDYLRTGAPDSVVGFIRSARGMGRAFFAPPDTDPTDAAALRDLLEAIVADPDFIQEAQLKGISIAAKSGLVLTQQIDALIPSDDAARTMILNAYACGLEMSLNPVHECDF